MPGVAHTLARTMTYDSSHSDIIGRNGRTGSVLLDSRVQKRRDLAPSMRLLYNGLRQTALLLDKILSRKGAIAGA